jgi:hypothetical protein
MFVEIAPFGVVNFATVSMNLVNLDIRHVVDSECDDKMREFFETFDPEKYPINNPLKSQMPGSERSLNHRPHRFTTRDEFFDGRVSLWQGDLVEGVIFPKFVPNEVMLQFQDEIPIRLKPVGNRLTFPWIPTHGHRQAVALYIRERRPIPCEVVHCDIGRNHRKFIWDFAMTTTFQLGTDMFTIQYAGRRARVTKRPLVRNVAALKHEGWLSRLATIFHF